MLLITFSLFCTNLNRTFLIFYGKSSGEYLKITENRYNSSHASDNKSSNYILNTNQKHNLLVCV